VGGPFALIAGFVGLVGLGMMISNAKLYGFDPVGGVVFGLLLLNGLYAVYLRISGKEAVKKKRGPLS
jgi:uncharacterized membrane protein required for colicin V production